RNRCVIAQVILAELCRLLGRRYRPVGAGGLDLIQTAIKVLLLDATNAMALHYSAAARDAKGRSTQLDAAIQGFSQAIGGVRQAVSSAVAALASASDELTALASTAVTQADKAAAAADSTASGANEMAAATEEMAASISEIRRQAASSASMVHEAVDNAHSANTTIA